jgi:UDP-glucose 4-epimerase
MTRKAIVTGGAGFIGSHLTEVLLDRDWEVLVVDDLSTGRLDNLTGARRAGVGVHVTDIAAPEVVDLFSRFHPEVVFHLAAHARVRASVENPIHDAQVNIIGTLSVLRAAQRAGVRKVCFASSGGAVYGSAARMPVKETAVKHPASPYGISKKVAEDYFRWYREAYGLEYSLLALANVYGPRQDAALEGGVVAIFAKAMLEGRRPVIFGDGNQTRDFVYVGDVCDAFVRAADGGNGLMMNIGTGTEITINRLYEVMADLIGYAVRPDHVAPKAGEVYRSVVDPSRARKELGWAAWTDLRTGLEETIAWTRTSDR